MSKPLQRDWTPREDMIPCLSIQQPYASAIAWGYKTIELRTWITRYRGLIAIHAGKQWYGDVKISKDNKVSSHDFEYIRGMVVKQLGIQGKSITDFPLGAIVATAHLVKCTTFTREGYERLREQHRSNASWSAEYVGWQFDNVQALPEPIPMRGQLGLFPVELALFGSEVRW